YTLTAADNEAAAGLNGLPSVTGLLTIRGADARRTTIERATDAPNFRLFLIAPTGWLMLEGLSFRGGHAVGNFAAPAGLGGAILNFQGRLTMRRVRVTGHTAEGGFAFGG